jgi:hypothetical protein
MGKLVMLVRPGRDEPPSGVANWIVRTPWLNVLNGAGNRASVSPAIGARVEALLAEVFQRLAEQAGRLIF